MNMAERIRDRKKTGFSEKKFNIFLKYHDQCISMHVLSGISFSAAYFPAGQTAVKD